MNRALLQSAMEVVSNSHGYSFMMDSPKLNPTSINTYPVAFMTQPKFNKIEGRRSGQITYDFSLHLMQQGAKLSPHERNELYAEMECDVIDIFTDASKLADIVQVKILSVAPSSEVVDSHGAIAMVANVEVTTCF